MKNYLTEPLTKEEKKEIKAIIWMAARSFNYKKSTKKDFPTELIDSLNLTYNDLYEFEDYKFDDYRDRMTPLTETEKTEIVSKVNILMDNLCLYEFKRALTFNEKLVFFFIFMENYKAKDVQFLLSACKKTIYNRQESVKNKIKFILEVLK